jgi:hypothetical protein
VPQLSHSLTATAYDLVRLPKLVGQWHSPPGWCPTNNIAPDQSHANAFQPKASTIFDEHALRSSAEYLTDRCFFRTLLEASFTQLVAIWLPSLSKD